MKIKFKSNAIDLTVVDANGKTLFTYKATDLVQEIDVKALIEAAKQLSDEL